MRMCPSTLARQLRQDPSLVTSSEVMVFDFLKAAPISSATALHSLRYLNAPGRPFSEVDFVVVTPKGVLSVEVKGGSVNSNDDGTYTVNNLYTKKESPLDQAARNSMAIRDWLRPRVSYNVNDIPFGHAAILPHQSGIVKGMDVIPQILARQAQCASQGAFNQWLDECIAYWWRRMSYEVDALSQKELEETVCELRRQFEVEPAFDVLTASVLKRQDQLSHEQIRIVDASEDNERLVVTGGAGSGKTFVIRALARRAIEAGTDVGVLIPRPELAPLYKDIQQMGVRISAAKAVTPACSLLFVDEGQDLCNAKGFELLDASVQGGIDKGRWKVFLDQNIQADLRGCWDETYFDLLRLGGTRVSLKDNYRNTDGIISLISATTGAEIGNAKVEDGPNPDIRVESASPSGVITRIRTLLRKGVLPNQIAVLTYGSTEEVTNALRAGGIPLSLDGQLGVHVGSPESAQGFEFPHVILALTVVTGERFQSRFYVGASRARYSLTVLDPSGAVDRLMELAI